MTQPNPLATSSPQLTNAMRRNLEFLLQGMGMEEIAAARKVSVGTVKMQMKRIAWKLRVPTGLHANVWLAVHVHARRRLLGIRCQACGEC